MVLVKVMFAAEVMSVVAGDNGGVVADDEESGSDDDVAGCR